MCGILGQFTAEFDRSRFSRGLDQLSHRGPDAGNIYVDEGLGTLALGHRRLSIIDLKEASNQPFVLGRFRLVFNGEIYNYIEVRAQLQRLGCVFRTEGDTEVLAQALAHWGLDGLDRLEGMWAFAWYDSESRELSISRDRFGEKPLLYIERDGAFYFGSEIKAVATLANVPLSPNMDQLKRYMVNGYKSLFKTDDTFVAGMKTLPAGTVATIRDGRIAGIRQFWKLNYAPDETLSYEDCVQMTREKVLRSVELRLRSDAPLAFCLSGGIDSNTLVNAARMLGRDEVQTYTIVNSDSRYEEMDMVELTAQLPGVVNRRIPVSNEGFLGNLQKIIAHRNSPVATISYYLNWQLLGALSADGYRVSVSGTAADELFTGYFDHHNLYFHSIRDDTSLLDTSIANWKRDVGSIVRNPVLQDPLGYISNPNERSHIYFQNDRFAAFLAEPWSEDFVEQHYCDDLLRMRMLNELATEIVPVILQEDDLNAMYFSVENRSPFLDRDLAEFAFRIPSRYLVRDGKAKAVLRDAMRGIVPLAILDNPRKVGFNAPMGDLYPLDNARNVEFLLDSGPVFDLIDRPKLEHFVRNYTGANSESKFLFSFLNVRILMEGVH